MSKRKSKHPRYWTSKEDRIMKERLKEGVSVEEIAKELDRTPGAITNHIFYLKAKKREERMARISETAGNPQEGIFIAPPEMQREVSGLEDGHQYKLTRTRARKFSAEALRIQSNLENMKVNQSFTCDASLYYMIKSFAKKDFPEIDLKIQRIPAHPYQLKKFIRVFRVA